MGCVVITQLIHANVTGYVKVVMLSTTQESLMDYVNRNLLNDTYQQLEKPVRTINEIIKETIEDELHRMLCEKIDTYPLPYPD